MSELEKYISEQTSDGGKVESSGRFTIDFRKAREKLARFQLARPTDYLLKLMQAAVLAGCREVQVSLQEELVIQLPGWSKSDLEQVAEGLCNPLGSDAFTPTGCLLVALNAALAQGGRGYLFLTDADGQSKALTVDAHEMKLEPLLTIHKSPYMEIRLNLPKRDRGAELEALQTRCRYLPLPILIDGAVMPHGGFAPYKPRRHLQHLEGDYVLAEWRPEAAANLLDLPPPDSLAPLSRRLDGPHSDRWLTLRAALEDTAEIHLVQAGVWVDTKRVEAPIPGLQAVVSVDHLKTDLTGMQVLDGPDLQAEIQKLFDCLPELKKQALSSVSLLDATRERVSTNSNLKGLPVAASIVLATILSVVFLSHAGDPVKGGYYLMAGLTTPMSIPLGVALVGQFKNLTDPGEASSQALRRHIKDRLG
ncbi:MAG: hypothetical protein KC910_15410 [Candidatus Eremiobacteraeota bacterium]|nr:hypothetical protein [Candidatus Eremiobacteraeota bacterium]